MKIETKDIVFSIDGKDIIRDINVLAKKDLFTGIIGPNGSGKSTFLKCIYRTQKPDSGCIFLGEENLLKLPVKQSAKHIAVMAQQNAYSFNFTVEQMVLMGRAPHKKLLESDSLEDKKIVTKALSCVGMIDFLDRSFQSLSGGEQQRVLLARAFAQTTDCMILDEPTNYLDVGHQLQLMKLVKASKKTVLAAIHDFNIAFRFCDYLYAMKEGKVVYEGTPMQVLTPENIQDIYGVKAQVITDSQGSYHVVLLD